jgi:hypothetical protein
MLSMKFDLQSLSMPTVGVGGLLRPDYSKQQATPQSGAFGFLTFIQVLDGPER